MFVLLPFLWPFTLLFSFVKTEPSILTTPPASLPVRWSLSSVLLRSAGHCNVLGSCPFPPNCPLSLASKLLKLFCTMNLSSCLSETRSQQLPHTGDSWAPNLVCVLIFLSYPRLRSSFQWLEWLWKGNKARLTILSQAYRLGAGVYPIHLLGLSWSSVISASLFYSFNFLYTSPALSGIILYYIYFCCF